MLKNTHTKKIIFGVFFIALITSSFILISRLNNNVSSVVKSQGGEFSEAMLGAPRFINPVLAQSQTDKDISSIIYQRLLRIENQEIRPELALDIDVSEDGKKYELELKDDIFFSDGKKLSSDDVIFTIEKIQDPRIKSPYLENWRGVTATKVDSKNITLELEDPYADFIYNLEIGILPKHVWENISIEDFAFHRLNTQAIGSGPYMIDNYDYDPRSGIARSLVMKRNSLFTPTPYLDKLTFTFLDSENERASQIKGKKVDATYNMLLPTEDEISDKFELHTSKTNKLISLFINTKFKGSLADKEIRLSVSSLLNRETLNERIFSGNYSDSIFASSRKKESSEYLSKAEAHQNIKSKGWEMKNGFYTKKTKEVETILSFNIATANFEEFQKVSNEIKTQLEKEGIKVNIQSFDTGDLQQKILRPREFETILFGYEIARPSDLYAFWHSSQASDPGLNISQYKNTKLDLKLSSLRNTFTEKTLSEIEEMLEADTPALFLYSPNNSYLINKRIQGVDLSSKHRYDNIHEWYTATRRIWNIFIQK